MDIKEYKSECSVKSSNLRKLSGQSILILKVFKPYNYGWDDSAKKYRSFYKFPARLDDEVVYSGSEEAKIREGDTFVLREKFWDNDAKKFGFRKFTPTKGFTKTFKKVFDVDVAISKDVEFNIYDSSLKQEIPVVMGIGNTFTIKAVGAKRIIDMIEAHELDEGIILVDGKDKAGNPAKIRPYDFEDSLIDKLSGKFVSFKVRGEGLDTRYTFKEGDEFDPTNVVESNSISIEDVPF